MWARWILLAVAAIFGWALAAGCSGATWDAKVTGGRHKTDWHHGFEIEFSAGGFKLFIGPPQDSRTEVENEFVGAAKGQAPEGESPGAGTEETGPVEVSTVGGGP
jgi:hypothetical protein